MRREFRITRWWPRNPFKYAERFAIFGGATGEFHFANRLPRPSNGSRVQRCGHQAPAARRLLCGVRRRFPARERTGPEKALFDERALRNIVRRVVHLPSSGHPTKSAPKHYPIAE